MHWLFLCLSVDVVVGVAFVFCFIIGAFIILLFYCCCLYLWIFATDDVSMFTIAIVAVVIAVYTFTITTITAIIITTNIVITMILKWLSVTATTTPNSEIIPTGTISVFNA